MTATTDIATSFGYDAAGNRTRYTDGKGGRWMTTYNTWNLPESLIEPFTATYNTAAASTFTTAYDADGRPVSQTAPGGVNITTSYDSDGNATGQTGSGAEAATATRSFTFDKDGRILTAPTAAAGPQNATSESFTYNDRSQLLTVSGTAGASSFGYTGDGLVSSRADASGTSTYAYDTADRLSTINDAASGNTLTYNYNNLDQVSQIGYGTGNNTRSFGYDSLHRVTSDTVQTAAGANVASITYGWDADNNITSKTTTGFGTSAANTYTYDNANRLTNWNNGTASVAYGYDSNGNRTQVGAATHTYDARDELTSDGTTTYSYTARGTASAQTGGPAGAISLTFDAFGQNVTAGPQTYTYDALGRATTTATTGGGTRTLSYSGMGNLVAADGGNIYGRDPDGQLVGTGTVGQSTGSGNLTWTDAHTDVVADFTATGSTLTGSATYDPTGKTLGIASVIGSLRYQKRIHRLHHRQRQHGRPLVQPGHRRLPQPRHPTQQPGPELGRRQPVHLRQRRPADRHRPLRPPPAGEQRRHHPRPQPREPDRPRVRRPARPHLPPSPGHRGAEDLHRHQGSRIRRQEDCALYQAASPSAVPGHQPILQQRQARGPDCLAQRGAAKGARDSGSGLESNDSANRRCQSGCCGG